jgi:beta-galactosidase
LLKFSRRQFLLTASLGSAGSLLLPPKRVAAAISKRSGAEPVVSAQPLDSGWQFRKGPLSGPWEVWRSEENSIWQEAALPHCFNALDACDPGTPYYRGQGWYRTEITVNNPFRGGRTILHFRGSGQTTTAWVGTIQVGFHKGGYDEFSFDITEALGQQRAGKPDAPTKIVVMCDNSPDLERVPSDLSDFCLYGGLYRHVSIIYLPSIAIDAVHVLPSLDEVGKANATISVRLYNPDGHETECDVAVELTDPSGRSIYSATHNSAAWKGLSKVAELRVSSPDLWSPESPKLYRCRVTLINSTGRTQLEERFGFRKTEFVEHGPFKLNGKRLLLRGTQRHVDHAGLAAAMTDDLVREELKLIRDMGANFIRLAHYQQDRLVLDLCDELGLMVWEEAPWCRAGVGDRAFQDNAKGMLTAMIDQHFNHPSIILWGLGNEDDWPEEYPNIDKQAIRDFMTEMRDLSHRLDPSRLTAFRRCDFARDIPDVYSPSIWAGWYRGNYREYEQSLLAERDKVKRFIHIEWGADSLAGRHAEDPEAVVRRVATNIGTDERGLDYLKSGSDVRVSKDGDWSETYACNLFDWYLKTQEKLDWLTGSAQWIFKDFASPLRSDNDIPRMNQKGVVERDLTKKESYFVFQSYWANEPMAHIYGHTWPVRWGNYGEHREVKVYSNCERAELFLNGKSVGIRHRDSQNFPAAGLRWDVAFINGQNHLRVAATMAGKTVMDEISLVYQTEPWGKPAELRLIEKERKGGTVTVEAKLYDSRGVLCLDSRNLVKFSIAGDGKLLDNHGTSRGSREIRLYNGRAQISLQKQGGCTVGVTSDGLHTALLNIS